MRTFILLLQISLLLLAGNSEIYAQRNSYEGTWHYQDGNELFIVSLWEDGNDLLGHYKRVVIDGNGNILNTIYNSNKLVNGSNDIKWSPVINATIHNSSATGMFLDNTINSANYTCLSGEIKLNISQIIPYTIHWQAIKGRGLDSSNEPNLSIPTDIVLTKVSNTVNLD